MNIRILGFSQLLSMVHLSGFFIFFRMLIYMTSENALIMCHEETDGAVIVSTVMILSAIESATQDMIRLPLNTVFNVRVLEMGS